MTVANMTSELGNSKSRIAFTPMSHRKRTLTPVNYACDVTPADWAWRYIPISTLWLDQSCLT